MVSQAVLNGQRSYSGKTRGKPHRDKRTLGSVTLARGLPACRRAGVLGGSAALHDCLALYLPVGEVSSHWDGLTIDCPAEGALLLDAGGAEGVIDAFDDKALVILLPRRVVAPVLDDRVAVRVLKPTLALASARRLTAQLLESDFRLNRAQALLAGRALSDFVVAALTSLAAGGGRRVAALRKASLLDRLTAYADEHLSADLDVAALCSALGCSRSALYRATNAVGGVAAWINGRRLEAVYALLRDAAEQRSIAAVARAHGLSDPAAFSRNFKRRFTLTPAEVRRRASGGAIVRSS